MELCRLKAEFAEQELAELAAGRIRQTVRNVRGIRIRKLGKGVPEPNGRERFTMLPANLRMENYVTAVMISEISNAELPEYHYRKNAELTVLCDKNDISQITAILHALGAVQIHPA